MAPFDYVFVSFMVGTPFTAVLTAVMLKLGSHIVRVDQDKQYTWEFYFFNINLSECVKYTVWALVPVFGWYPFIVVSSKFFCLCCARVGNMSIWKS